MLWGNAGLHQLCQFWPVISIQVVCKYISLMRVLHELKIKLLCRSFGAALPRVPLNNWGRKQKPVIWGKRFMHGHAPSWYVVFHICCDWLCFWAVSSMQVAFFKSSSVFLNICVGNWYFPWRTQPPKWKLLNKKLEVLAYPWKYQISTSKNILSWQYTSSMYSLYLLDQVGKWQASILTRRLCVHGQPKTETALKQL